MKQERRAAMVLALVYVVLFILVAVKHPNVVAIQIANGFAAGCFWLVVLHELWKE